MPFEEFYKAQEDKITATAMPRATSFSGLLSNVRSPSTQQEDDGDGGAQFSVGSGEMEEDDEDDDDKLWLQNLGVSNKRLRSLDRGDTTHSYPILILLCHVSSFLA